MRSVHRQQKRILELLTRARTSSVLLLGAGVTGQGAAEALLAAGYEVVLLDQAEKINLPNSLATNRRTHLISGFQAESEAALAAIANYRPALAVSSPGIPPFSDLFKGAGDLPIVSEVDLATAILGMPEVAVTGTNGKTTVVTLITEMLSRSGIQASAAGNVGAPLIGFCDIGQQRAVDERMLVCEVSSYQLEHAAHFAPRVSVILNVADDHLVWHKGFDNYLKAKRKIFSEQQSSDWSLLWREDPYWEQLSCNIPGRVLGFGVRSDMPDGLGCWALPSRGKIVVNLDERSAEFSLEHTSFLGLHNQINLAVAAGAALLSGASASGVQDAIDNVKPLPHRLEHLGEIDGIQYINDSKATNVSAVAAALDSLALAGADPRIVLLLGGLSKEGSWRPLAPLIAKVCRKVVAFGADRAQIVQGLAEFEIEQFDDLETAFNRAKETTQPGDILLLSPGCASFDEFPNYKARGNHFKNLVQHSSL